ncbi:hypothetical protein FB451DRAFT_45967 [Mycena latifolia]|nr:hypothetical protein FB451DRAFT_45967 [Mycena latifolia]
MKDAAQPFVSCQFRNILRDEGSKGAIYSTSGPGDHFPRRSCRPAHATNLGLRQLAPLPRRHCGNRISILCGAYIHLFAYTYLLHNVHFPSTPHSVSCALVRFSYAYIHLSGSYFGLFSTANLFSGSYFHLSPQASAPTPIFDAYIYLRMSHSFLRSRLANSCLSSLSGAAASSTPVSPTRRDV